MQIPLETAFRHIERTADVENEIRSQVERLERLYNRITACRVVVEAPTPHRQQACGHRVKIHLSVPRRELVVDRRRDLSDRDDVLNTIRSAFRVAGRQIKTFARELRNAERRESIKAIAPVIA